MLVEMDEESKRDECVFQGLESGPRGVQGELQATWVGK